MKRFYFTKLQSEIIDAETEADAREQLEAWTGSAYGFTLERVEDIGPVVPGWSE